MELLMRSLLAFATALAIGGILLGFGLASGDAHAAPVLTSPEASPAIVEKVAMYGRRYRSAVPADPYDDSLVGEAVPAPVIVIRPPSCGVYKYWDGAACVDARYTNPYLGPKG
jgi:hypothetical protein